MKSPEKKQKTASLGSHAEAINKTSLVSEKLKAIYKDNILPSEKRYQYDFFYDSPYLTDVEFDAKPHVMLIGQYSVGKTSFIKYMLGRDFPGSRIGPEPTTDKFTCLINGPEERTIPGNALSVHPDFPFRGLERFGVSFLSRFEGSQLPSSVLRSITLIDTPGILSGEKQRVNRGYDFTKIVAWFAERADLILLMFDAHKLDISDELKATIDVLKGHEDKIRCILNKADQINRQQLMRVYGALLWSLGKTISSPEVLRVYVGTFWSEPLHNRDNIELFEQEEKELMRDLAILPRQSAVRKINELVKRIRKVKALAYIIGHLQSQMPSIIGKEKKQRKLIEDLPNVFRTIMKKHGLSPGDFPDIAKFSIKLKESKFTEFKPLKMARVQLLEDCLNDHLPRLLEELPSEKDNPASLRAKFGEANGAGALPLPTRPDKFGKTDANAAQSNPFGASGEDWALEDNAERLRKSFEKLGPVGGFLAPQTAKEALLKSGLKKEQLREIWNLSDIDRDGFLDHHEYVVAMYLVDEVVKKKQPIPSELPKTVIPPSKRQTSNESSTTL